MRVVPGPGRGQRAIENEIGLRSRGLATDPPGRPTLRDFLALVRPEEPRGVEFGAVVIVEPAALATLPGGTGLLDIAPTLAVQHLRVLHERAPPSGLGAESTATRVHSERRPRSTVG